jgi:hypothetical protein
MKHNPRISAVSRKRGERGDGRLPPFFALSFHYANEGRRSYYLKATFGAGREGLHAPNGSRPPLSHPPLALRKGHPYLSFK